MANDITFNTGLDLVQLRKDLNAARKAVDALKEKYDKKSAGLDADSQALEEQSARLDALRQKVEEYKAALNGGVAGGFENYETAFKELPAAEAELAAMEKSFNGALEKNIALGESLERDAAALSEAQAHAGALEEAVAQATQSADVASQATEEFAESADDAASGFDKINRSVGKIYTRIGGLVKRVLFFSVITSTLRKARQFLSETLKQNEALQKSLASLKGAATMAVTPLINAIVPALIKIVEWATKAATAIAQLIGWLTGKSLGDMKKAAKALSSVGSAGKAASKSLASFDTIQKIGDSSGGGGGSSDMGALFDQTELTNAEMIKMLGLFDKDFETFTIKKLQ